MIKEKRMGYLTQVGFLSGILHELFFLPRRNLIHILKFEQDTN